MENSLIEETTVRAGHWILYYYFAISFNTIVPSVHYSESRNKSISLLDGEVFVIHKKIFPHHPVQPVSKFIRPVLEAFGLFWRLSA